MRQAMTILIVALFLVTSAVAAPLLTPGSIVPSLSLTKLSGQPVAVKYESKLTLLSFFASFSASSQEEIKFLQNLHKQYSKNGLKVIGISFDKKNANLNQLISQAGLDFEIMQDPTLNSLKAFRVIILPTLFVIDQEGKIRSVYVDFDSNVAKSLEQEISKALK